MKRFAIIGLVAVGLLTGACGDDEVYPSDIAARKCGVPGDQVHLIEEVESSGYNGMGPGYITYETDDGRQVQVYKRGDGSWGTTYNGECD